MVGGFQNECLESSRMKRGDDSCVAERGFESREELEGKRESVGFVVDD